MKTNLEQLQEILCTVESVEKDVKELRFGCRYDGGGRIEHGYKVVIKGYTNGQPNYYEKFELDNEPEFRKIHKIIGTPLTLKHLMMYCNEKGIIYHITNSLVVDMITFIIGKESYTITFDSSKELYEQEDKVLLDIINFLKG